MAKKKQAQNLSRNKLACGSHPRSLQGRAAKESREIPKITQKFSLKNMQKAS